MMTLFLGALLVVVIQEKIACAVFSNAETSAETQEENDGKEEQHA